ALRRPAAVVRNRGHVLDGLDLQAGGGKRLDRRLAARTRALDLHVDPTQAEGERLAGALLGSDGRRERRGLLRTLEPGLAGRAPRDRVAVGIRDRDERIVEG